MAKIEFIFTFKSNGQSMAEEPFSMDILADKSKLADIAIKHLTSEQKLDLVKVSTCVYFDAGGTIPEPPAWYMNCNGKMFFSNGELEF